MEIPGSNPGGPKPKRKYILTNQVKYEIIYIEIEV